MDSYEQQYEQSSEIAIENNEIEACSGTISNCENMEILGESMPINGEIEGVRCSKRTRQMDHDEMWTNITRRGKRFARTSLVSDEIRVPEDKIEVSITSVEKIPKQFGLAKLLKLENIPDITNIKYINAFKVLIQFNNEESANKLIESKYFKENGLKCQKTLEIKESYGVIKDIDLDLSDELILESLTCDTEITGIKRLKRRNTNSGHWEPGEAVRLTFKGSSLPTYVYIFETRAKVSPYQFPVTQCSRCWRFGHTVRVCSSIREICPKCSQSHPNCDTVSYKCNNCSGKHMALSRTCPIYLKERKIRELMAEFNCTYKRALTLYVPPEPNNVQKAQGRIQETEREYQELSQSTSTGKDSTSQNKDTYADTLKKAKKKATITQKYNNKKGDPKRKQKSDTMFNWTTLTDSDSEISQEDTEKVAELNKEKNNSNWKLVWIKLKEKIWNSEASLENKVMDCVKVLFEWVSSFIMEFITEIPLMSKIKKWIVTTGT